MNSVADVTTLPGVSVVIATALAPSRLPLLRRCIRAAADNARVAEVIVVVNGERFMDEALAELRALREVRVEQLPIASYPAALRRGRELVTQDFFCFVDDDDELLTGSVACRLARAEISGADIVLSNGYRCHNGEDEPYCSRQPIGDEDLMLAMLEENWFASCAPLFRTNRVGVEFFDGRTKFLEWTLLVFKLIAAGRRFAFVTDFGFRINDTAVSLSKDPRGLLQVPPVLRELIGLARTRRVRDQLKNRLCRAHHACADVELSRGALARAWHHHLKSLILPGGSVYWSYTRYLLAGRLLRRARYKDSY